MKKFRSSNIALPLLCFLFFYSSAITFAVIFIQTFLMEASFPVFLLRLFLLINSCFSYSLAVRHFYSSNSTFYQSLTAGLILQILIVLSFFQILTGPAKQFEIGQTEAFQPFVHIFNLRIGIDAHFELFCYQILALALIGVTMVYLYRTTSAAAGWDTRFSGKDEVNG